MLFLIINGAIQLLASKYAHSHEIFHHICSSPPPKINNFHFNKLVLHHSTISHHDLTIKKGPLRLIFEKFNFFLT